MLRVVLQAPLDRTLGPKPEIVNDNGPEFVSQGFVRVVNAQEPQRIRTLVQHPHPTGESNGAIGPSARGACVGRSRPTTPRPEPSPLSG
jgi:hypothetical protein